MAKLFDEITDPLREFIAAQPMFFVGTAPSGDGGHINVSPKGGSNLFHVTGPHGLSSESAIGRHSRQMRAFVELISLRLRKSTNAGTRDGGKRLPHRRPTSRSSPASPHPL